MSDPPAPGPDPTTAVEQLLALVAGTSISEVEVEVGGLRVRLQRDPSGPTAPAAASSSEGRSSAAAEEPAAAVTITSAYVGSFHCRGEGLPEVGERVAAGAKIAEIEVLGIHNPVVAPVDGVITDILVHNEEAVEYGQPLIVLRPQAPGSEMAETS